MKISLSLFSFFLFVSTLWGEYETAFPLSLEVRERYADLLDVQEQRRFLEIILDPTGYGGFVVLPPDRQMDLAWAEEKVTEMVPVLLEVLRREENVESELGGKFQRQQIVVNYAKRVSSESVHSFREEVRRQIPQWSDPELDSGLRERTGHLVYEMLDFLGVHGEPSDRALIEAFLDDRNSIRNRDAQMALAKFQKRMAEERSLRGNTERRTKSDNLTQLRRPDASTNTNKELQKEAPMWWIYLIGGILIAVIYYWLRK